MKKILVSVIGICLLALSCLAEGTVTETRTTIGTPDKIVLAWTSSTNEWASLTSKYIRGEIARVLISNEAGVTTAYDVTLEDSSGIDTLLGNGANLVTNVITAINPALFVTDGSTTSAVPFVVNDRLSLLVTNCGSEKSGQVILYVR